MELSISGQALDFLLSCLLGVGLGVLYDLFRIVRMAFWHGKLIVAIQDVLFWTIAAVATFLFLLMRSEGQIRFYILLGEALGFVVYYFTVGVIVFRASKWIVALIKRVLCFLYRLFVRPMVRLLRFLFQKMKMIFVNIALKCKNAKRISKIHLHKKDLLLYNQNSSDHVGTDLCIKQKGHKKNKGKRGNNRMAKVKKGKKILLFFAFIIFVCYIAYQFISLQINLNEQRTVYAQIQQEISEQKIANDELTYILENGGEAGYLESIARDMGFVDPEERIFVDISK